MNCERLFNRLLKYATKHNFIEVDTYIYISYYITPYWLYFDIVAVKPTYLFPLQPFDAKSCSSLVVYQSVNLIWLLI